MRTSSFVTVAALAVALSAGLGGLLGQSALATQDRVPGHYQAFTAALAAIEAEYAEPVESDRLVYGGINGMLQTLDPHSSFMDPKTYAQMRERQEQRYYGLGITIQSLDRNITVVRVFEGSPAHQKGLRRGDDQCDGRAVAHQSGNQCRRYHGNAHAAPRLRQASDSRAGRQGREGWKQKRR